MRALSLDLSKPPGMSTEEWIVQLFQQIEDASREDAAVLSANAFTVENLTELTTFDASSADLATLRQVVGTLINYIKQQGPQRSQ